MPSQETNRADAQLHTFFISIFPSSSDNLSTTEPHLQEQLHTGTCSNPTLTPAVPDNPAALEPGLVRIDEPLPTIVADPPAFSAPHAPPTSHYLMVTQSNDGTRHLRVFLSRVHALPEALSVTIIMPAEPTCYSQAIRYPKWCAAMAAKFDALIQNFT